MSDSSSKILIMGVGGCGSGFIVRCLENCGLDTGGYNSYLQHGPVQKLLSNGVDPKNIEMPRVIKHLGGFMHNLNQHIDTYGWKVEHIFLAVASYDLQFRELVKRRSNSSRFIGKSKTEIEDITRKDYPEMLGLGVIQLIARDHSFTIVRCPRSIKDPEYLYNKLKIVIPDVSYKEFKIAHDKTISPRHLKRLDKYD